MVNRNSHCSHCGQAFPASQPWPRLCSACGNLTILYPIPWVAVILPVHDSVLLVRRGNEPYSGKLMLPGGPLAVGETWQQAGARMLLEESGVAIRADELSSFDTISGTETILMVGVTKARTASAMPRFKPSAEVTELVLASSPLALGSPEQSQMLKRFLVMHRQLLRRRRTSHAE